MRSKKDLSFLFAKPYVAHRGFHNQVHPENTTGAFKLALDANFSIEFDIQLTKDEQVVIFHDDDMERLVGTKGRVCDHTFDELQQFRILGSEEKIPLFKDILELVNGKQALIIELKSCKDTNQRLVEKTIELLKDYKGKYILMCFDPTVLRMVRKIDPCIIRGQLVDDYKEGKKGFIKFMCKHFLINWISKPDFMDTEKNYYPKKLQRIHKKIPVICWTIKNKEEQENALKIFDNITFDTYDPR